MVDYEKKYSDFAEANERLRQKNAKLLAETLEMEKDLERHGLLSSSQLQQI